MKTALSQTPLRRRIAKAKFPLYVGFGVIGAGTLILLVDPMTGVYPTCPSQLLFGIDCPLCGGLRGSSALLQGDFARAADHNVLLFAVFPIAIVSWVLWFKRSFESAGKEKKAENALSRRSILTLIFIAMLLAAFTLVRNVNAYLGSGILS